MEQNRNRNIRISQRNTENCRLAFVKNLKDITGFGLKEAKDIADKLNYSFNAGDRISITVPVQLLNVLGSSDVTTLDYDYSIRNFTRKIGESCTGNYIVDVGVEWGRESKLLSLGIGSDSDFISFIKKMIMYKNSSDIEDFIGELLSSRDRVELEKIYNKLTENGKCIGTL